MGQLKEDVIKKDVNQSRLEANTPNEQSEDYPFEQKRHLAAIDKALAALRLIDRELRSEMPEDRNDPRCRRVMSLTHLISYLERERAEVKGRVEGLPATH